MDESHRLTILYGSNVKSDVCLLLLNVLSEKERMRKEMEAEIRANLALNQEAMQSWDEKVRTCGVQLNYLTLKCGRLADGVDQS